jgi:drug/metabolite transporter (DMT)-like permease
MKTIELLAMFFSFSAVIIIAVGKPPQTEAQETNNQVIGVILGMTNAFCMSSVSVTTRKMQQVHYSIVLLSYAIFGVVVLSVVLVLEAVFFTG